MRARSLTAASLGLALLAIAACEKRPSDTASAGRPTQVASSDTGAPMVPSTGAAGTAAATPALTDPNIVALLDAANEADSAAGAFASKRATNADVKAFARLMMGEHHALRLQGQQLAKSLKITPQPPANDPVKAAAQSEMNTLQAAPKGAQFDRTYIEQEITMHRMVLDLANQAHAATQQAELKALIEKARPVIEKHLARAQEIQQKLGTGTSAT
jgi:putative membrane protein